MKGLIVDFNKNLNLLNKPTFVYDEKTKTLKKT